MSFNLGTISVINLLTFHTLHLLLLWEEIVQYLRTILHSRDHVETGPAL